MPGLELGVIRVADRKRERCHSVSRGCRQANNKGLKSEIRGRGERRALEEGGGAHGGAQTPKYQSGRPWSYMYPHLCQGTLPESGHRNIGSISKDIDLI